MNRESVIFPFLYQLRQIRKGYKPYYILVTIVELLFILNYLFQQALTQTNSTLLIIIGKYKAYVIQNSTVYNVLTFSSCFFLIIIATNITLIYARLYRIQNNSSLMTPFFKKSLTFLTVIYSFFEIVIIPTFIIILDNINTSFSSNSATVNYLILPFLIGFIVIDHKRRLLQNYLILIGGMNLIISNNLIIIITFGIIAAGLSLSERKSHLKQVIYLQMSCWCFLIFVMNYLNQQIILYQSLLILLLLVPIYIFRPISKTFANHLDQNTFLLDFLIKTQSDDDIIHAQRLLIMNIVYSFHLEILHKQVYQLTNQQQHILEQFQHGFSRQKCLKFTLTKISMESQRQMNNISLKIQSIYSKLLGQKFTMQILLEISQLAQLTKGKNTFQDRFDLFQLTSFVQKKYLKKQEHINALTIINFQKKKETFYSCVTGIIVLMLKFWEMKKKNLLSESIIFTIFSKIQEMESEIITILDDVKDSAFKEKMVYDLFMRLVNNTYKMQKHHKTMYKPNSPLTEINNSNYILVQQNKILEMSCQIRNQFEIPKQEIQDYRTSDIFPKLIIEYINSHMDNLVQEEGKTDESVHIILPFLLPNSPLHMMPFKVNLRVIPDIMNGIKYIIHFQDSYDVQIVPSILYAARSDRILLTTNNISSYFSILWQIQLSDHFASEIFGIDLFENLKQKRKHDEPVQCDFHINSSMFKNQGLRNSRKMVLPVALKVIKTFNMKQQVLFLIQIFKKKEYDHRSRRTNTNIQLQKLQSAEDNTIFSPRKSKDINNVFCKINNPYEHVIHEKFIKLKNMYKLSYLKLVLTMIIIILGVIIAINVLFMAKVQSTGNDLMQVLNINSNKNNQITNIYVLFSQSAILHQLRNYPQQFLKLASYNISSLITEYIGKVAADINLVLNIQITNIQRQSIDYKLQFNNFNVSAKTNSTNILDYLQYAQQYLVTDDLTFLVKNWPSIPILISSFESQNVDVLRELVNYQFTVCAGAVSIIIAAIFAINVVCLKAKSLLNRILNLYENIQEQDCQKFIKKLNEFNCILYKCNNFTANNFKNNQIQSQDKIKGNSQRNLSNLQQSMNVNLQQNLMQSIKLIQKRASVIKHTIESTQQHQPIQRRSTLMLVMKINFLCLVPIILILFFIGYYTQIIQYENEMRDILKYFDLMQNSCNFISYRASDFLMAGLQEILPQHERIAPNIEFSRQIFSSFESQLPSYYNNYKQNQTIMLNFNLCAYSFLNTGSLYKNILCKNILGGAMQSGFSQTVTLYLDLIANNIGVQMKDFGSTYRIGAKYPVYIRTLYNMIIFLQGIFNNDTVQYMNLWNSYLTGLINYIWLLLLCFIGGCCYYYWKINQKCRLALRTFYVLPKSFLLQMNITKILRKEKIIDQIERLAF